MSEAAGNFDFMELGQAIMDAREKQRITREELAEELGISARHFRIMELLKLLNACAGKEKRLRIKRLEITCGN